MSTPDLDPDVLYYPQAVGESTAAAQRRFLADLFSRPSLTTEVCAECGKVIQWGGPMVRLQVCRTCPPHD